jgi:hypothetical protein
MIATTMPFIGAATYRLNTFYIGIQLFGSLHYGSEMISLLVLDLVLVLFIIFDMSRGKTYSAYWVALGIYLVQQAFLWLFTYSKAWIYISSFF